MSDPPRNPLTRAAKLATLPVGFAGRTAWGIGKRIGGRPAEQVALELQARTAGQLFKVLGELKGGAMKFGQALSIFEAALPEEIAGPYRATLTRLQDSAPPMPVATVQGVLRAELGEQWRDLFTSFDDAPVAAASIGQVHRGVWHDGRSVAVKIQYPGAGKALLGDLSQLSRVARMAGALIPGVEVGPLLEELRARMSEELDYRLEAESQQTFADALAGDPEFFVPSVVANTERVLVSEWVDGRALSTIITDGSPVARDAAAQLYMDFLLAGPSRCGLLHADPHPGNFKLTPEGRLGVVDFGAVNRLPDGLPRDMGQLLTYAIDGDAERTVVGLRETGFVRDGVDVDGQQLLDFLEPFIAPLRTDSFHFSREWMREVFSHLSDPRNPQASVSTRLNLPPDYLLIHRVWLGGIGVLCQIGGTVHGRAAVTAHVPGADLPPLSSR